MTTQLEAFPKTTMEVLESLRCFHVSAVEKARTALDTLEDDEKIARRYEKAEEKLAAAQQLVREIDSAIEALQEMEPMPVPDKVRAAALEMKRHAEESGTTVTISAGGESVTFGAGVDPVTGEVEQTMFCDVCSGEGRLRDKTGGGHHKCSICKGSGRVPYEPDLSGTATVLAVYPGSAHSHATSIGPMTRYGELVADYFTAAGLNGNHDAKDWTVLAEHELTAPGGGLRKLRDVIAPADYGRRLLIAAADQGSAAG